MRHVGWLWPCAEQSAIQNTRLPRPLPVPASHLQSHEQSTASVVRIQMPDHLVFHVPVLHVASSTAF